MLLPGTKVPCRQISFFIQIIGCKIGKLDFWKKIDNLTCYFRFQHVSLLFMINNLQISNPVLIAAVITQ